MSDVVVCNVCGASATHKCGSCKAVSYCGKEHQKEDWKTHKLACQPFEVKSSPELGRYLEATRRLARGDLLFTEAPLVVGPRPDDVCCLGCYNPHPQDKCPKCLWPACCPTCPGLVDAEHHGAECVVLRMCALRAQDLPDDFFRFEVILPLRCLLLQRRSPKKWKSVLDMEGHTRRRGPNSEAYKQTQERVVNFFKQYLFNMLSQLEESSGAEKALLPERSDDVIHKVCGVIDVNTLEVHLADGAAVNGLYATASLMEHNCLPNTRHVFDQFKVTVMANQDVALGGHLSTMYTHALWGTQQRQAHLRSNKYFTCRCRRCGDPTEINTYLSALRCLAPGSGEHKICGGWQLPVAPLDLQTEWRCDKCPISLTSAQVTDLVGMIGAEVEHAQNEQQPTVEGLKSLLDKLRKLLHPNHFHCYAVMHSLVQLYGRQPGYMPDQMNDVLVQKKIRLCKDLLDVTYAIDPTSSRLALFSAVIEQELASAMMILAKRRVWTRGELPEKLQEAKSALAHARESLAPEQEGSPGRKMVAVVEQAISELDAYVRYIGISL